MSFVLKKNGEQIAISRAWNTSLFGNLLQTSFPKSVNENYIWENGDYWLGWEADPIPILPTPEEIALQKEEMNEQMRLDDYRNESDPLFFQWQRGEVDKQVWLDKVAEIKQRYI